MLKFEEQPFFVDSPISGNFLCFTLFSEESVYVIAFDNVVADVFHELLVGLEVFEDLLFLFHFLLMRLKSIGVLMTISQLLIFGQQYQVFFCFVLHLI